MRTYLIPSILILILPVSSAVSQNRPIERSCPDAFAIRKDGTTREVRYASNRRLDKKDTIITTLLIYIHGLHRNALNYYDYAMEAVHSAHQKKTTLVITLQYANDEDMEAYRLGRATLFWKKAEWKDGYSSISPGPRSSSYEILDSLIIRVLVSGKFPNIRRVVIAGHSAGGQYVQCYSAISPVPDSFPDVMFRFIIMNPSSYLYPDALRAVGDGTFDLPDSSTCPTYNHYPKGMVALNNYASVIGSDRIIHNMLHRDIVILLGGEDTSPDDPDLDVSCVANLQGRFRLERGLNFISHDRTTWAWRPNSGSSASRPCH
jgi:hypothetical protein